jgi:propanol-preferring alcohol dehydrogenase
MVLERAGSPLKAVDRSPPVPGPGQVRLAVRACGVCRTDLHVADGELAEPKLPLVLGHEIVGTVVERGAEVRASELAVGARVGVPWLGWSCGTCAYCLSGRENLCARARFTGYHLDGGYATECVADARFCLPLPATIDDRHAAPLLCAGVIGHRALGMAGAGEALGLYGFGAAAHIVAQIARGEGRRVYAFTRPGDHAAQHFALDLGAVWAGDSSERPPEELDAAILFAPVGALVPLALRAVKKGGTVVAAGIHMSDIPSFPYPLLWGERTLRSVANLTRQDGLEFLRRLGSGASRVTTEVEPMPLEEANEALRRLRAGEVKGAIVLSIG